MRKKILAAILPVILFLLYLIGVLLVMNAVITFAVNSSLAPKYGYIYCAIITAVLVLMFLASIYIQKSITSLKKKK